MSESPHAVKQIPPLDNKNVAKMLQTFFAFLTVLEYYDLFS